MGDSSTEARTLRLNGVSIPLLSIPVRMKPSTKARSRVTKAELAASHCDALGRFWFGIDGQFRSGAGPALISCAHDRVGGWPRLVHLADITNTVGAPSLRCLQGRVPRAPAVKLRHPIPERNLRPSFIHPHRPGFIQKIETITAPAPLLGRFHQSSFYRIAMHVPEFLHARVAHTTRVSLCGALQLSL